MIGKKLVREIPIPLTEVKEIIEKRKKEGELSYEQNLTLEYCKKFTHLKKKEAESLIKELVQLDKIEEPHAVMLANLLPVKAEDLSLIFSKEHFLLSGEELNSILDILNKYRK